jgi:protoheme IX farnesyltransferase
LVTLTTALGYILAAKHIGIELFYVCLGIFLLAAASSALNHWQERRYDSLMDRTKNRPIPSKRIQPVIAVYVSLLLLIAGSFILIFKTNITAFLIGIVTFIWYNFIYTPLKIKTAFAIIPGALVGALPPIAGWAAAGGNLNNISIFAIAVYFFIWQIPHFWLLLIMYGNDYEKGGFPTLFKHFSSNQLKRITFMWLIANIFTALFIPMFVYINNFISYIFLILACLWMFYSALMFLFSQLDKSDVKKVFISINFFTLFLITLLSIDKLIKVF